LPEQEEIAQAPIDIGAMNPVVRRLLPVAGIVGVLLWFGFTVWDSQATTLEISRHEAVRIARDDLASRGIELGPEWREIPMPLTAPSPQHDFVWQEGGEEAFGDLYGTYLGMPRWSVRFARFEGDVAERAEEYIIHVSGVGDVVRYIHVLPEARPGADLGEEEARQIAGREVRRLFGLAFGAPDEEGGLREISADTSSRLERRDWTFTFEDPDNYPLDQGSARVVVTVVGDEASNARRFVYVPEEWTREDRNRNVVPNVLGIMAAVIGVVVLLGGAVVGGMAWAKGRFSVKAFLVFFAAAFGLTVFQFANDWPSLLAGFSTAMPIASQVVIVLVGAAIAAVGLSAVVGLVAGYAHWQQREFGVTSPTLVESLWVGAALGGIMAGVQTAMSAMGSSLGPPWPDYSYAGAVLPFIGTVVAPVTGFMTRTLLLLLVCTVAGLGTSGWTRRTQLFATLLVLLGFLGAGAPQGVVSWVASGLAVGALLLIAYRFVLRYDLAVLPVAVVTAAILGQTQGLLFEAYPGAVTGRSGAIVLLAGIALWWAIKLRGDSGPGGSPGVDEAALIS